MRADELVSLAAAHGIDLKEVAGNASDTKGVARVRARTPEERRSGRHIEPTARGAGSRVHRKRMWTAAELGQAAQGVPRMPWLAACYSLAGDSSGYPELHRGLMAQAIRIATRENWPMRVRCKDGSMQYYIAELAQLVLDVEAHKHLFVAAPALYAICMHMEEEIYATTMAHRYVSLRVQYERWLGTALSMIQSWLTVQDARVRETA